MTCSIAGREPRAPRIVPPGIVSLGIVSLGMVSLRTLALSILVGLVLLVAPPQAADARIPDGDETVQAALRQVEDWFAKTQTLKANFVQIDERGYSATGKVWLRRPGRVRFEYDPPVPLLIVADGIFVVFVDKELEQVDRLPLLLRSLHAAARHARAYAHGA